MSKESRAEAMFAICAVTVLIVGFLFVLEWFGARQFEEDYKDSIAKVDSLSLQVTHINRRMDWLHLELVEGQLIISSKARPSNVVIK